jgi:hypothetical protein
VKESDITGVETSSDSTLADAAKAWTADEGQTTMPGRSWPLPSWWGSASGEMTYFIVCPRSRLPG